MAIQNHDIAGACAPQILFSLKRNAELGARARGLGTSDQGTIWSVLPVHVHLDTAKPFCASALEARST